jgi:prepilin-type N-terminal cleavage/methylation domain-containing protein
MMRSIGKTPGWDRGRDAMFTEQTKTRWTMGRRHGKNGFTLIELLVVIGIMGIIFGVAVPAFYLIMPNIHLRSAARVIGSASQQARLKAATNTSEYRICFNSTVRPFSVQVEKGNAPTGSTSWTPEGKNYWEIADDVDVNSVANGTAVNFKVLRPDGTTPTVAGNELIFKPNGATNAGGEFVVKLTNAGGRQFEVRVSATTGRVKVNDSWTP